MAERGRAARAGCAIPAPHPFAHPALTLKPLARLRPLPPTGRSPSASKAMDGRKRPAGEAMGALHASKLDVWRSIYRGARLLCGDASAAREQAAHARALLPAWPAFDAARLELATLEQKLASPQSNLAPR